MVHLGSKIGRQTIQFFVWYAATGFDKSLPEGLMGFACTCGGWGLLTRVSLAMRLVWTLVLLQLLQRFGDQGRDRLTSLA
jgi:hypothetical protein